MPSAEKSGKIPLIQNINTYKTLYSDDAIISPDDKGGRVIIGIVTEGSGYLKIINYTVECSVGDVYIIKSDMPHSYFAKSAVLFPTVMTLEFEPKYFFAPPFSDPKSADYCYGIFGNETPVSFAILNSNSLDEIIEEYGKISLELQSDRLYTSETLRAYLSIFVITVARYLNLENTVFKPVQSKYWMTVSAAMREIFENYSDNRLTLESIADKLYISKSHLSRLFQTVVGKTFLEYVRSVRLNNACNLLVKTDLTNEEIVEKCGFKDIPTFYRAFKAYTGTTPHSYRAAQNKRRYAAEHDDILNAISDAIEKGMINKVASLVEKAISLNISPGIILNDGLLKGMNFVGDRFRKNELYLPSVLLSARAINVGMEMLKPDLEKCEIKTTGRVCIGTVKGDLHDIGKNLVKIMMESKGIEVIDLGIDVATQAFIDTAVKADCKMICCSALLTTTMGGMKDIVEAAKKAGIRDKVKIMVGGAPLSQEFCDEIAADFYTPDAATAAAVAAEYLETIK